MSAETENKSIAFSVSLVFHALLIAFLLFFVLTTPNPPLGGGSGVVLNLGFVDEGTGEVQTLNAPNDSPENVENKPSPDNEPSPTSPSEENTEKSQNSTNSEENLVTSSEENDVKTEPNPDKEEPNSSEKNISKENNKKDPKEQIKETNEKKSESEKVKSEPKALYGQIGTATNGGNNNGDKVGKTGDQGNPQGDINAKALYGNLGTGGNGQGGSGGSSLDLAGWKWDKIPRVKDENEDENGKLVFQITIDSEGEITNIVTLEKTVSPSVEKLYRDVVEKLTFIKTDSKIPAPSSTGKITFIIRAK
jgi:outer membrane biosynthesis protein TonB